MNEQYVVEGATLICEFGGACSKLKVPEDRHIYIDKKRMANKSDINGCIQPFSTCSSIYREDVTDKLNKTHIDTGDKSISSDGNNPLHMQRIRRMSDIPACCPVVPIPWQDVKEDVFDAHYEALIESSWTMCLNGGRISVKLSGQEKNEDEKTIMMLEELEDFIYAYFAPNKPAKEEFNKLLFSTIMWNNYGKIPWKLKTDDQTIDFYEKLREERPSLANYFESQIAIKDPLTNGSVDLTYLFGMCTVDKKESERYFYNMPAETRNNPELINAYTDAYLIHKEYVDADKPLSEVLKEYYGVGDDTSVLQQKGRYINLYSDPEVVTSKADLLTGIQGLISGFGEITNDMGFTDIDYQVWGENTTEYKYNISQNEIDDVLNKMQDQLKQEKLRNASNIANETSVR